jgi:UDP-N-acetylglucosamine:LPS N-acetylglucosamine transferase
MSALVAAAACVVQNAGGMTSLESLAAGTPTLTYRPIPGHGTTNASVLSRTGLVPWVAEAGDLATALRQALATPSSSGLLIGQAEVLDVLVDHGLVRRLPVAVAA